MKLSDEILHLAAVQCVAYLKESGVPITPELLFKLGASWACGHISSHLWHNGKPLNGGEYLVVTEKNAVDVCTYTDDGWQELHYQGFKDGIKCWLDFQDILPTFGGNVIATKSFA